MTATPIAHVWLIGHIALSVLSYLAFLVAGISGILFLVQERQLKAKHVGRLFHSIPSLAALDQLNLWAIALGFALFTLALGCGVAGRHAAAGRWLLEPTEGLAYVTWGLYAALLVVRLLSTLRGHKVALLSVLGFGLALFTFVGVHLLLPAWHAVL